MTFNTVGNKMKSLAMAVLKTPVMLVVLMATAVALLVYFGVVGRGAALYALIAMGTLDPIFNELSATTRNEIRDGVVYNCFWVDTPLQDHMRRIGAMDPFGGGTLMQSPFIYNGPDGGGVSPGQTVTVTRKQLVAATGFIPKAYAAWFAIDDFETGNGEHAGVINAGPNAAVDLYLTYLEGLTQRLNTFIEMDFYRHGQANAATVSDNRSLLVNGAAEAINDGVTPSWDGNRFPNYGAQARNGAIQNALNSIPQWAGNPDGSAGQISYEFLLQSYTSAIHRPKIGITSKIGYTYIASLFQRQQRFDVIGVQREGIKWKGIAFEDAVIYDDWLVPSAVDPSFLPAGLVGGGGQTNVTSTFDTTGMAPSAASHLPANTVCTVAETLWWIGDDWKCRPTTNPAWFFGVRRTSAYDNVSLDALFMRLAINCYSTIPRDNILVYGFGS